MKNYFFTTLIIFTIHISYGQDIEIIKKEKNDNYVLPNISKEMTFEEFKLLSETSRMKDMMYAVFVPGYYHFKVQEPKKGYWLLGIRGASYLITAYVFLDANNKYGGLISSEVSDKDKNKYQNLLISSITIGSISYLYDVIHGENVLHNKQEQIRYKYAIQLTSASIGQSKNDVYPALSLSLKF
jgi:hypothetical protein